MSWEKFYLLIVLFVETFYHSHNDGLSLVKKHRWIIDHNSEHSCDLLNWDVGSFELSLIKNFIPPEYFSELIFVHFNYQSLSVSHSSQFPTLSKIRPWNRIQGFIDLLIWWNIINNLNSLQILIIVDVITHDVMIA